MVALTICLHHRYHVSPRYMTDSDSVCVLLCFCISVTFAVSFKMFEVDFLLACCEHQTARMLM